MKKKEYEQPTIDVVQLKQRQLLLAGSGSLSDPEWHEYEE